MKRSVSLCIPVVVLLALFVTAEGGQKKDKSKPQPPPPPPPPAVEYSSATANGTPRLSDFVRVGNMLYLSGKLGTDSTGKLAAGGIVPETRQTLENIRATLEKNGSSMDNVIK